MRSSGCLQSLYDVMIKALARMGRMAIGACLLLFGTGAQAQASLDPVRLDRVRSLLEAGRWIWLGDSFAVSFPDRLSLAALRTWPFGPLGAFVAGPYRSAAMLTEENCQWIGSEQGYVLGAGTAHADPMGLPLRLLLECPLQTAQVPMGDMYIRDHLLSPQQTFTGSAGALIEPLLYVPPSGAAQGTLSYENAVAPLPSTAGFHRMPAAPVALTTGGFAYVPMKWTPTQAGIAAFAGTMIRPVPAVGRVVHQTLADASWSYSGFALDADPTPTEPKRFRTDDLVSYLQATTVEAAQEMVFVLYLAAEGRGDPNLFRAIVARLREACARAGLPAPLVLLVHPHAIRHASILTPEQNELDGRAMREVALTDPDVAFVSLYQATDGVVFDGRLAARTWIASHVPNATAWVPPGTLLGPYNLRGGHLLDPLLLHPGSEAAAVFFAWLLGQQILSFPAASTPAPATAARGTFALYPSPTSGDVIHLSRPVTGELLDASGRRLQRLDGAIRVDVGGLPAGVYAVVDAVTGHTARVTLTR